MRFTAIFGGRGRKGHYKLLHVKGPKGFGFHRDHCWVHEGYNDLSMFRKGDRLLMDASLRFYGSKWTLTSIQAAVMP